MAIAALILGISSLICSFIPFLSYLALGLSIAATILGAKGRNNPDKRGMATAGMVMGIIGIALSVIFSICYSCTICAASTELASYSSSYYW